MNVVFEEIDACLVARACSSCLDADNARAFKDAVAAEVGERPRTLILDLSAVNEIDSAGLGTLVAVLKWMRRFGGSLRVCGLQPEVREVIELTMLQRILPLHNSLEEALAHEPAAPLR